MVFCTQNCTYVLEFINPYLSIPTFPFSHQPDFPSSLLPPPPFFSLLPPPPPHLSYYVYTTNLLALAARQLLPESAENKSFSSFNATLFVKHTCDSKVVVILWDVSNILIIYTYIYEQMRRKCNFPSLTDRRKGVHDCSQGSYTSNQKLIARIEYNFLSSLFFLLKINYY